MNNLQIMPLDLEKDIPEIKEWEKRFSGDNRFNSIRRFILEGNTYYGLDEVIKNNYEFFHIGDDERKFCFSVKDGNTIAGFILACVYNISIQRPELFIQYVVLNPDYQGLGYGSQILEELLNNPNKYFAQKPVEIHAYVNKDNLASLNMCKKFGFSFKKMTNEYVKAHKQTKTLEDERI